MNTHLPRKRFHRHLASSLAVGLICCGTPSHAQIAADDFSSSVYDAGPPATVSGGTGAWVGDWTYGNRGGATEVTDLSGGSLDISITAVKATSDVGAYGRTYDFATATSVQIEFQSTIVAFPTGPATAVDRQEYYGTTSGALDLNGAGGNSSWLIYGSESNSGSGSIDTGNWVFASGFDSPTTSNKVETHVDTGVPLALNDTYQFVITENFTTRTWSATVTNLTTFATFTSGTLNFRDNDVNATTTGSMNFSNRFSNSGDTSQFIIDNVSVSAVAADPPAPVIEITSYDEITGLAVIDLEGVASTPYQITATDDLDFSTGTTVLSLTDQGTGVVAGNGLSVTTTDEGDGTGLATVGVALGTTGRNFARAEDAP